MEAYEVSLAILDYIPAAVIGGMAVSTFVVSAVSVMVSGYKALLRMIGR